MQDILVEKPYQFIPRYQKTGLAKLVLKTKLFTRHLKKHEGINSFEVRNAERLRASLDQGHGILLAPNHSRTADPIALGYLCNEASTCMYAMASWHLFHQGALNSWLIHKMGAFSVNREGFDRQAIDEAIDILVTADRPLVIFPEGTTSRCNDILMPMMDGVSMIARTAAKRRAKQNQKVVVHPVAFKYVFGGDVHACCRPVISEIEARLGFRPQHDKPLLHRIKCVGNALLSIKELEFFGKIQSGSIPERQTALIEQLLTPLEQKCFGENSNGTSGIIARIKAIRVHLLSLLIEEKNSSPKRTKYWKQLEETYLAQQIFCYPDGYLDQPTENRVLETLERFEEDLTDKARVHGSLHVVIDVGEAIEVKAKRTRGSNEPTLMQQLQEQLQSMLDDLSGLSRPFQELDPCKCSSHYLI